MSEGEDFGAPKKIDSALDTVSPDAVQDVAKKAEEAEQQEAGRLKAEADAENRGDPTSDSENLMKAMVEAGTEGSTEDSSALKTEDLFAGEFGVPEQPGTLHQANPNPTGGGAQRGHEQKHLPLLPYTPIMAVDWDGNPGEYIVHGYKASSSSSSSSSGKTAIVPFRDTFIAWFCAEEPEARFFDTLTVPVNWMGLGRVKIPDEFIESIEGEILVISAISQHIPAAISATVKKGFVRVNVKAPLFFAKPPIVYVRIQAKRRRSPERWERKTKEQANKNAEFWGLAHG